MHPSCAGWPIQAFMIDVSALEPLTFLRFKSKGIWQAQLGVRLPGRHLGCRQPARPAAMFRRGGPPARPENALQRAEELLNVGQNKQALQVLHDTITNKKHRTWSKTFEEVMIKLVELAVDQKNRNSAKEALMQYRNMCQSVAINSLEEVIKHYLDTATAKAEEARQQAEVRRRA